MCSYLYITNIYPLLCVTDIFLSVYFNLLEYGSFSIGREVEI